jgi:hypothetical protein
MCNVMPCSGLSAVVCVTAITRPTRFPAFNRIIPARAARLAQGHDDADPLAAATIMWSVPHGLAMLFLEGPISQGTTPRALEALARAATVALTQAPFDDLQQHAEQHWGI